ncbi:TM1802 family CRISPR-associated protein [Pelotomaculum propionicicum]|uniref:CRISPR-associated protein Csh1 n=1 Tax=Pelotomaculum propionicicum TaxID=258475 RepID=A0A4Y7RWY6_9FIRM|nr:TM1802 family CRISPR-associated protein [Pelotomaculum propionicicum]TEB13236.1 hypothetical protein Pmgp_00532 [Pelotomaculum propionicicum]
MNLPQITAMAGVQVEEQGDSLASLVKERLSPQPKLKNDDEQYVVFLTFDLDNREIRFEDPKPFRPDIPKTFNYFGNNGRSQSQYYLVREVGSLVYLLSTVWNDLALMLDKYGMKDSELRWKLRQMEEAELVTITGKKGEGTVNLQKLLLPNIDGRLTGIEDKKKAVVGEEKFSFEDLVRRALGVTNKNTRFLLVIPALRCHGEPPVILSRHPDYLTLVGKVNRLENTETEHGNNTGLVCSVCRNRKPDVKSEYNFSFPTGLNKIFTMTTINYASGIGKSGYDRVYAFCNECYKKLLSGQKLIREGFRTWIAGENAFILPEGIIEHLSYNYIERIRDIADLAFQSRDALEWIKFVEAEAFENSGLYSLNIIVYREERGKSVSILQTIEDVPLLRFQLVMRLLAEGVAALRPHVRPMSLGSVYHLIPVRKTEKGQVNVQRVLSFYKSLLSGEMVYSKTLFGYAVEALDKGLRQLSKQKLDNYENLNLTYYRDGREDFFIKHVIMSYLALFRVCGQLELLDRPVFAWRRRENMAENNQSKSLSSVEMMEDFLEQQGFLPEARALFYLGALVNQVAWKQSERGHKTKPVLDKINYQGMSRRDILRLYEDTLDLVRHYFEGVPLYIAQYMERFHNYFGSLEKAWSFNEQENVFYIMSGYAYLVKGASDSGSGEGNADEDKNENQTEEGK